MKYPSGYDDSIRKAGEKFLIHLYDSGLFKAQWDRAILTQMYNDYLDGQGKCFNRVLYHLFYYQPSLLRVRRHTLVVFEENDTDEFFRTYNLELEESPAEDDKEGEEVLPGRRPKYEGVNMYTEIALHAFSVPTLIRSSDGVNPRLLSIISQDLNHQWYRKKFNTLLHVEEIRQETDMESYRILGAKLRENGAYLCLNVPGLAEKRPSLLRGDRLFARADRIMEFNNMLLEGFIHNVQQTEIGICFNKNLHDSFINGMKFDIEFTLNRHSLKMMHRALQLVWEREGSEELLFPVSVTPNPSSGESAVVKMKNRDIEGNEKQSTAVKNIVSPYAARVYIVYGPPGTGKTVTMVEAIHQTLLANSSYRILVCAPSNSACDLLAQKLMVHVDKKDIIRIHAASRKDIPEYLKEVSHCRGDETELRKRRIIVSTLITAGRLASTRGYFDQVFVDEAGQALEPELMVAIGGNLAENGKVVLAGDPKQLGPIIRSGVASKSGLQTSFLERLMERPMYEKGSNSEYDARCVTKLLKNYRSHQCIIKVSNEEFYNGELEVCADEMKRNNYCSWEKLPKKYFPMIFKAVQGQDKQEDDSPSFFNPQEVKEVKKYVQMLLDERRPKILPGEIGIITPYRKQVLKIRNAIKNEKIKVGSVEEFQGQERRVIILSTVRSRTEHLGHDKKFALGFLSNPKRFNVAITRAQALLIVIGNPKILCRDKYWKILIEYCRGNGAFIGSSEGLQDLPEFEDFEEHIMNDDEDVGDRNYGEWRLDP